MIRILVDSPDPNTVEFLRTRLSDAHFKIVTENRRQRAPRVMAVARAAGAILGIDVERTKDGWSATRKIPAPILGISPMTTSPGTASICAVMNTAMQVRDLLATTLVFHHYLIFPVGEELIRMIEAGAKRLRSRNNGRVEPRRGES